MLPGRQSSLTSGSGLEALGVTGDRLGGEAVAVELEEVDTGREPARLGCAGHRRGNPIT